MRLISMKQIVDISVNLFNEYVEPVALSIMSGEVPSITFNIHTRGTKEKDWLAYTRFKNTSALSSYRCELYIDDIFRLSHMVKLHLVTEEVYSITCLWFILHPLYQSHYIYFKRTVGDNFESMMAGAGNEAYNFISKFYKFRNEIERVVLDILNYHMMIFTNHRYGDINPKALYEQKQKEYYDIMMKQHPIAYRAAKARPSHNDMIDENGYIHLSPRYRGG